MESDEMRMALGKSKFIAGEQHHLYYIDADEDWSDLPWRIEEEKNMYWIPVKHRWG